MKAWEANIEILAPIQVVWDTATNFVEVPAWNPYVTRAHILSLQPFGKGTVFAHERDFRQAILKIQEFHLDTYIKLDIKVNRILGTAEYFLKPTVEGTIFTYVLKLKLNGTDRFAAPFIGRIVRKELTSLKKWIEQKRQTAIDK